MTALTADLHDWKPRFFIIWSGQALSLVGSSLTQFVLVWWLTQETGSANALALAGVMAILPVALFSPVGGALADRLSRRAVMIAADAITAGCMLVLVALFASQRIQLWHIYTLMFVRATMQAFQQPAAAASTANLVPGHWLERVAGMNQGLQGVMTIASAPLGAVALALMPTQGALMIDVVTAVLGITPLFFFKIPQPRRAPASELPDGRPAAPLVSLGVVLQDIREGARYILHRRGLWMLYAVNGLVVLTIMPPFSLTPLLVKQHFNGGVNEVAVMEALAGLGIILGSVLIGLWKIPAPRLVVVLVSFAVSCGTVALTALAPGDMLPLAVFWWFLSGVTFSTGEAPMVALLQTVIPNELQGRTLALLNMIYGIATPLGLAIAGPLGEAFGVRTVFILGGALSALISLLALFSKSLWELARGHA
ncbi:MAG: MFS transporter [Chloroflexota bacterium]